MTEIIIKPLTWIVGGRNSVAYAEAFGQPGFYTIRGSEGDWRLEYPDNGLLQVDEGHETQISARRAAQARYERTVKASIDFIAKDTTLASHTSSLAEKDARIAELEAALKPFRKMAGFLFERNFDASDIVMDMTLERKGKGVFLRAGDFFAVAAALAKESSNA